MINRAVFRVFDAFTAVLAGVMVTYEEVGPRKDHFYPRKPVKRDQVNGFWGQERKGGAPDEASVSVVVKPARFDPFFKGVGGPIGSDNLGRTFDEMANGSLNRGNLDGLIIAIQDQDFFVKDFLGLLGQNPSSDLV